VPISYTNGKGKKYYIHVGETNTGKPKYYVALRAHGSLEDVIPDGFEIYEGPERTGISAEGFAESDLG